MTVGMFDTSTMLKALKQRKTPLTFLRDMFFKRRETYETEHVQVDIVKGKRTVAPFVAISKAGKVLENQGYITKTWTPAALKPQKITRAEEFLKRAAGENTYSPMNAEERAAKKLGEDLAENEDSIIRREEMMCAEALFSGHVTQKGDGVDQIIQFGFTAGHEVTLAGVNKWDDYVNSDPLGDLDNWVQLIQKDSGLNPDTVLMANDVLSTFIKHPKVTKALDVRKLEVGEIKPSNLPNGSRYIGTITLLGVDIYTYSEWYVDPDSGVETAMVPAGKVLMTSTNADFRLLYGALVDADEGIFVVDRYPRSWTEKNPSARFVEVQSRPIPVPTQMDAIVVATVV